MKVLIRFLVFYCLLVVQSVSAIEVENLFTAEVKVASQSREARNRALREALIIVLNRVMASKEPMLDPAVREALGNAASYVDQYQYTEIADASNAKSSRSMRVLFHEDAIVDLLRRSGLAAWNKEREEVLLWLVIKQNGSQVFLDVEQYVEFNKALQFAAQLKGIPVLLPLMDLEEKQAISVADIVSAYPEKLMSASRRYGVTAILSGRVIKQRSCWRSEWTLNFNNKQVRWRVPCENLTANLSTAFQGVYEHLSVFYAEKSN